jgi:predicted TIM-barrel fold metal-dependent hydrolase
MFIYPSGKGVMDEKKKQNIEEVLQKLLVDYTAEEGEIVVKVGKGRRLPEAEFRATINELKKMGFKFDPDTKTWRKRS